MKTELHIKHAARPETGYLVAFKDKNTWRCVTLLQKPRAEALEYAVKYAKENKREFFQTICDCGTEF